MLYACSARELRFPGIFITEVDMDHTKIDETILVTLQPRQLEQLYWMAKGHNGYGVAHEMGLSNSSIPRRQNSIRDRLGLHRCFNLQIIAKRNRKWLLKNVKPRGRELLEWQKAKDALYMASLQANSMTVSLKP